MAEKPGFSKKPGFWGLLYGRETGFLGYRRKPDMMRV